MHFARVKLSCLEEGGALDARGNAPRPKSSLAPLVASIKAQGLLQPLVVRKIAGDVPGEGIRYKIIAGNRRFAALRQINGKKDVEVAVMIDEKISDSAAFEKSLAENVIREAMHPVDEFEAYARLIEAGWPPEKIADRFGVKEKWVRQRLQLKRLAPELRDVWRKGKMTGAQAEALTASEDHEAQKAAWSSAQKNGGDYYERPDQLRSALRSSGYSADDRRVKFIGGVEAYKAAGGAMSDDLFADTATLRDKALIDRLVAEKLNAEAESLRAEGWKDVEVGESRWREKIDLSPWMTPEEIAACAKSGYSPAARAARERATDAAIQDPEARARSSVFVYLDHDGEISCDYLCKLSTEPEDDDEDEAGDSQDGDDDEGSDDSTPAARTPATAAPSAPEAKVNHALVETVSEWLTLALSDALLADAHTAIAALGASLDYALRHHSHGSSPLRIEAPRAWDALTGERGHHEAGVWCKEFARLCNADETGQRDTLTTLVSKLIDVRAQRFDDRGSYYVEGRGELLRALGGTLPLGSLAMAIDKHFDRAAYFGRLTKDEIGAALKDMGWTGKLPAKKGDLAKLAAERAKALGWLPPDLRMPGLVALPVKDKAA